MSNTPKNDRWIDVFLLRMREPENAADKPYYTTGSIVTAAMPVSYTHLTLPTNREV